MSAIIYTCSGWNLSGMMITERHSHQGMELLYVTAGKCRINFSDGREARGSKGSLFIIPPGIAHERRNLHRCKTFYVIFELTGEPERILLVPHVVDTSRDRLLRQCFVVLSELNGFDESELAATLIKAILLRLARLEHMEGRKEHPLHPALKTACKYFVAHCGENISVSDAANAAHVSQSHLNLLFRQEFGTGPLHTLLHIRMRLARQLLRDPYYSITEIARTCGFRDIFYFSRRFKQFHDIAPKVYRADPAVFDETKRDDGLYTDHLTELWQSGSPR